MSISLRKPLGQLVCHKNLLFKSTEMHTRHFSVPQILFCRFLWISIDLYIWERQPIKLLAEPVLEINNLFPKLALPISTKSKEDYFATIKPPIKYIKLKILRFSFVKELSIHHKKIRKQNIRTFCDQLSGFYPE